MSCLRTSVLSASFLLIFFTIFAHSTHAQSKSTMTLSPAFLDIQKDKLADGGYSITFENGENVALTVTTSFIPFTQSGQSDGTLQFLPDQPSTLANYLVPSSSQFEVAPKSKTSIQLLPTEFMDTLKGDYYEAMMFRAEPSDQSETFSRGTSISSSLALLLFVRTDPRASAQYTLGTQALGVSSIALRTPRTVQLELENRGNTYGIPRGEVTVRDAFGGVVSRGSINEDSVRILPSSRKTIEVTLAQTGPSAPAVLGSLDVVVRDDRAPSGVRLFRQTILVLDPLFIAGFCGGMFAVVMVFTILRKRNGKR